MTDITAKLNYFRVAPRKIRLVVDLVRGKDLREALSVLEFITKKSAGVISKLLKSAASNAKHNFKINGDTNLYIKKITVDEGPTLKRFMPRAQGRASLIKKRTSHITVVLSEKQK